MFVKASIFSMLVGIFVGNHPNALVNAFTSGAPICTVGEEAFRGSHTRETNRTTGSLAFGSFVVTIGNTTLNSSNVNYVAESIDLPLVLSSLNGTQFRGVAIILNQPGVNLLSNLFIAANSTEYKVITDCISANYAGTTHVDSTLKDKATATVNLPVSQSVYLDVGVVVANNANVAINFYSRFQLSTMKPPTKAPTKAPTREDCGLFKLNIFCFNGCGLLGRLFGLCD